MRTRTPVETQACHSARMWSPARCALAALIAVFAVIPVALGQLYTDEESLFSWHRRANGLFGYHVAASGEYVVVGTASNREVHILKRDASGWTNFGVIAATYPDFIIGAVAIHGNWIVAGNEIYAWNPENGKWGLQQRLPERDGIPALQGDTLALGVGHEGHPQTTNEDGAVYVYLRNGGTWDQQALLGPDVTGSRERLGESIALDGDTILASGSNTPNGAYVFVREGMGWTRQGRLRAPTGGSWLTVALSGDLAAVGDPANERVHVFQRSGTTWQLLQSLPRPGTGGQFFGSLLAFDGKILAAGAAGTFHLYAFSGGEFALVQTVRRTGLLFGGLALANEGKSFYIACPFDNTAAPAAGVVVAHDTPPATWGGNEPRDIGLVGVPGGSVRQDAQWTLSGSGADIWARADAFQYVSWNLSGDGGIIARLDSLDAGNSWAKLGLMFREDDAPAAREVMVFVTPGRRLGLQHRAETGGVTLFQDAGALTLPAWLMLARQGDVFAAFRSADGDNWTAVGSATLDIPETLYVGPAITSHDNSRSITGVIGSAEVIDLSSPGSEVLSSHDIGTVRTAGATATIAGVITIRAAGTDIWGTADSFHYHHGRMFGDFDVRVRVRSLANTNPWAKAGIMARDTLDPRAPNVFALLTAGNAAGFQSREAFGGATAFAAGPWQRAPRWLRLVRSGNTFQGFLSPDGSAWTSLGKGTFTLPFILQVGLAVTSHDAARPTEAVFDSFPLSPTGPPPSVSWTDVALGTGTGGVAIDDEDIDIVGRGADLWGAVDSGLFVYRPWRGDGEIVARVEGMTALHPWAKAGLMIRSSLAANAANACVSITPANGAIFQARANTGTTTELVRQARGPQAPGWLRLARTGSTCSAAWSTDGTNWVSLGTRMIDAGDEAFVGFAVSSHDVNASARAVFSSQLIR